MDIREYIETTTGIPTAEVAFIKPQKLPFIAVIDRTDADGDDFHTRVITHNLTVEFYAERIDAASERSIEDAFERKEWKASKDRVWINGEKMFETIYSINFTEKR